MSEEYNISMEVSGKTAMWTRPDTGATPVSYPAPPWSAAKGIFESVVRLKNTIIIPTAVEICAPIVYHDYTTNYGGPLRKTDQISKNDAFQHKATVLINVCYRLYARIEDFKYVPQSLSEASLLAGVNSRHYCYEAFYRRLKTEGFMILPVSAGGNLSPIILASFGVLLRIETAYNEELASFLYCVFGRRPAPESPVRTNPRWTADRKREAAIC